MLYILSQEEWDTIQKEKRDSRKIVTELWRRIAVMKNYNCISGNGLGYCSGCEVEGLCELDHQYGK
jgi:hypothetical protein